MTSKEEQNIELRRILLSAVIPAILTLIMWLVKLFELIVNINLHTGGIFPRRIKGLSGILFSPFLHGSFDHLIANTIPFIVLGTLLFYFYREVSIRAFVIIFLMGNILLWVGGRENYHIGASGVIYGLASFLFFSGVIRRYIPLSAISLFVVFLYGSMVWNMFPMKLNDNISWEGHLFGAVAGLAVAIIYRKEGPQRKVHEWEEEDDDDDFFESLPEQYDKNSSSSQTVVYTYIVKKKSKEEEK